MARTAKLEIEVDSSKAKAGSSTAAKELQGLRANAAATLNSLRDLARGSVAAGDGMTRAGRAAGSADKEIDKLADSARRAKGELGGLDAATQGVGRGAGSAASGINGVVGSMKALIPLAATVIGLGLAQKFLEAADATKQWEAQLKLAIPATMSLSAAQDTARKIAVATRGDLDSTIDLYGKFSRNAVDTGRSSLDAARATETFAKTLKISGAGAADASAATTQFGQALASGVLRGDEFNSIMEAAPRLSRLLAVSMGEPIGKLREMAEEGKLTADVLYKALTDKKYTAQIDQEFRTIPITFAEAMQRVEDTATVVFGAFDRGGGFSNALINFMLGGVENLDTLEKRAEDFGVTTMANIEGIGAAFDPLLDAGIAIFEALGLEVDAFTKDAKSSIAELLGAIDEALGMFEKARQRLGDPLGLRGDENKQGYTVNGKVIPTTTNMRERFLEQQERSQEYGNARVQERRLTAALPGYMDFSKPGNLQAFMRGDYLKAPVRPPAPVDKKAESEAERARKKAENDAKREAERQENLAKRRTQQEADLFVQLREQAKIAAMLPREAELYNNELRLRRILNDGVASGEKEISAAQRKKLADAAAERDLAEFTGAARRDSVAALQETARLQDVQKTLSASTLKNEADNLAIQERIWPMKLDAMQRGLSLSNPIVAAAIAEAEARERTNLALEKQNELIQQGVAVAQQYRTPGMQQDDDLKQLGDDRQALDAARAAGRISDELYEAAIKGLDKAVYETSHRFEAEFAAAITDLAGQFEGKFGEAFGAVAKIIDVVTRQSRGDFTRSGPVGGVINMFNGRDGNRVADAATEASRKTLTEFTSGSALKNPLQSLTSGFGSFKGDLKNLFGKGGDFQAGLGSVLGKAGMGAQIGAATSEIADLVGIKLNKTGSQIGGALGGAVGGPIGAIGGSVIGGLIGNLFVKKNYGTAQLTGAGDAFISSRGDKTKEAASGAATAVQNGLKEVADKLGGTIGKYMVSIGQYDGDWRVSTSGQTGELSFGKKNNQKSTLTDFKDDAAGAVAFAIQDAIKDGAITGIGTTLSNILKNGAKDMERALADALTFKGAMDELRSIEDPVNFALEALNKQFQSLADIMRAAGASSAEWADAEKLYQLKRAEVIEQGNSSALKQMREYLFELQGGTSSSLSPEQRLATATAELNRLDAVRKGGGKVEFGDYQSAADAFLAASRDAKGSTVDYFADLKRVTDTVQGMISETTTKAVTTPVLDLSPVVTSVDKQTTQVTNLLSSIDARLGALGSSGTPAAVAPSSGGSQTPWYRVDLAPERYLMAN